jgi:hypothetical protein
MLVKTGIQKGRTPCAPTKTSGFWVAAAYVGLPGMTIFFCCKLQFQDTTKV